MQKDCINIQANVGEVWMQHPTIFIAFFSDIKLHLCPGVFDCPWTDALFFLQGVAVEEDYPYYHRP